VIQIDPTNGSIVRTVASGLGLLAGLASDPVSGDLFVSEQGYSSVASSPGILRIDRTSGAVTLFAVGPSFVGPDGLTFDPDGILYVADPYTGDVWELDRSGNATLIAVLTGGPDGIAVGRAGTSAAGSLFVNRNDGVISRIDITSSPAVVSTFATGGGRGDLVGVNADGYLFATQPDRVIRITPANFAPTTGPATTCAPPVTGDWSGTWTSTALPPATGTWHANLAFAAPQITGTVRVNGGLPATDAPITGTVDCNQITFGTVGSSITFTGVLAADGRSAAGTYATVTGDNGTWQATFSGIPCTSIEVDATNSAGVVSGSVSSLVAATADNPGCMASLQVSNLTHLWGQIDHSESAGVSISPDNIFAEIGFTPPSGFTDQTDLVYQASFPDGNLSNVTYRLNTFSAKAFALNEIDAVASLGSLVGCKPCNLAQLIIASGLDASTLINDMDKIAALPEIQSFYSIWSTCGEHQFVIFACEVRAATHIVRSLLSPDEQPTWLELFHDLGLTIFSRSRIRLARLLNPVALVDRLVGMGLSSSGPPAGGIEFLTHQ